MRTLMVALPLNGKPSSVAVQNMVAECEYGLGHGQANLVWPLPCAYIPPILTTEAARAAYAMVAHVHGAAYGQRMPAERERAVALVLAVTDECRAFRDDAIAPYVATGSFSELV